MKALAAVIAQKRTLRKLNRTKNLLAIHQQDIQLIIQFSSIYLQRLLLNNKKDESKNYHQPNINA